MEEFRDWEINKIQNKYFFTDYTVSDLTDEYIINCFVDRIDKIFLNLTGQLIFKMSSGCFKMLKLNENEAIKVFEQLKIIYKDKF